jgi:large subunit ribosomal protein L33
MPSSSESFRITLACSECGARNYKAHAKLGQSIEFRKFCKHCKRHTIHREAK